MKTTEVNDSIIGKRCKSIFTGLMVTGVIEEINITQYTAEVKVRYDKPHNWGGELYEIGWSHARLHDEFGSLHHLEIIDEGYRTVKVRFVKDIAEIDKKFAQEYSTWGTVNLKEWIDNYESSRYVQIASDTAIITSEYNMDNLTEWLEKSQLVAEIEHIN